MSVAILFIFFSIFLVLGVPLAVSMGASVLLVALSISAVPLPILAQKLHANLDSFALIAVPFFFLAAALMEKGGIVRHLVNVANMMVGRFRGGLGMAAVMACILFAAISGSSPATVAAVGGIMVPTLIRHGYSREYAIGALAAAGGLGILLPPSIPLILYGFITGTSIPKLFMAGIIPGLFYGALLLTTARFLARNMTLIPPEEATRIEKLKSLRMAIPALSLPVLLIVGIYGFPAFSIGDLSFRGGAIFTPTEAAFMSVFVAIVIGAMIYKELTPRKFIQTILDVTPRIGMIYWISTNAVLFGFFIAQQGIPTMLADWLVSMEMSPWLFLLLVNIILIIAGIFLDGVPMILLFMPVLFPAATALGVDPIHFAIIVVVNIELGLISPPVGMNLFVISAIAKAPLGEVFRAVMPWLWVTVLTLLIITYVPWLSTFLPSLMSN